MRVLHGWPTATCSRELPRRCGADFGFRRHRHGTASGGSGSIPAALADVRRHGGKSTVGTHYGFVRLSGRSRWLATAVGGQRAADSANEGALQPADDELRNQLAASAMQLDQELRGSASSAGLRRFLELPPEVYAGTDADDAEPISGQHDLAELELMLRRYDRISRSPQLHDVSSLPSFRRTRRLLSDYVSSRQRRSGVEPELIPAEPLPRRYPDSAP